MPESVTIANQHICRWDSQVEAEAELQINATDAPSSAKKKFHKLIAEWRQKHHQSPYYVTECGDS